MRLCFIPRALGTDRIGEMIDRGVRLTEKAEAILLALTHWTIMFQAQMDIIVVRFVSTDTPDSDLGDLNRKIAKVALERNVMAVQTVEFDHKVALPLCIINPSIKFSIKSVEHPAGNAKIHFRQCGFLGPDPMLT